MNRLKLVILLTFVFALKINAQNVVHLCVGENHNFGVPPTVGSIYNWQVQNTTIATIYSGNGTEHIIIDLNNPGVFQLLVEEIDVNGCSGYDSILVEIHALPTPNIFALGPISFCEGDSVLLQVDSIYVSSIWNNGITAPSIVVDTTGEYFIEVADTNGCVGVSPSIFTLQHPNPDIDFSIDGICENMPSIFIDLSTIPTDIIFDRIWYLGDGSVAYGDTIIHVYENDEDYLIKLIVISDFGCLDSISSIISIYNQPTADFSFTPYTISTLQPEITFTNTSYNSIPDFWSFGDSTFSFLENPIHIYDEPGVYNVVLTVSDSNLCVDSISKNIIMYYDFVLYIPTSFTPDNDGGNDLFGPKGLRMEKYESYEFTVFNRWGERIFKTEDINEWWDGADSQNGSYSWVIVIVDELGALRKQIGEVMLIR